MNLEAVREVRACPSGDAQGWLERYAPTVGHVIQHAVPHAPGLTAVVVAYRSAERLMGCLAALRAQMGASRERVEIILLDNGGIESARSRLPGLVDLEVRMTHNVGLCPARNLGVALARSPLVAFIDDDGIVAPDFVLRALPYFGDQGLIALRGRIVWNEHRYFTALADHYDRGRAVISDALVAEGCSVVRRDFFVAVGGFSDVLSPYEGLDFTYRASLLDPSACIVYAPDVVMRHDYASTWRKLVRKSTAYGGVTGLADDVPEAAGFLEAYKATRFPRPRRRLDEIAARAALGGARRIVRAVGRLMGAGGRRYIAAGPVQRSPA